MASYYGLSLSSEKFCTDCGKNIEGGGYHHCPTLIVVPTLLSEKTPGVKHCGSCGHTKSRCSRCGRLEGCSSCGSYFRCSCSGL